MQELSTTRRGLAAALVAFVVACALLAWVPNGVSATPGQEDPTQICEPIDLCDTTTVASSTSTVETTTSTEASTTTTEHTTTTTAAAPTSSDTTPTTIAVTTSLNLLVPGPVDVATGQPVTTTTTVAPAPTSDSDNTGTVVAFVIAGLLVVALLLLMLTVWYWRRTKPAPPVADRADEKPKPATAVR